MRALASSTAAFEEILVGRALVDCLLGCEFVAAKRLRARQLRIGELDARRRRLQRRLGLFELDLIGTRIDHKEKVSLVHDLTVLEVNLGQRATDLRAQFHAIDCRELAEKANPRINLAPQRLADCDRRRRCRRGGCLAAPAKSKTDVENPNSQDRYGTGDSAPPASPARPRRRFVETFSFNR